MILELNRRYSYSDLKDMPNRYFHKIFMKVLEQTLTDEGRKNLQGKKLKDGLEELM